jgi:hypothetical protein
MARHTTRAYHAKTFALFLAAAAAYLGGVSLESGPLLLLGLALEVWCIVRAGRRPPR